MYIKAKTRIILAALFMLNFVSTRRFNDGVAEKDLKSALEKFNTSFPAEYKLVVKRMQTMVKEIETYRKYIENVQHEVCKKKGVTGDVFFIIKDDLIDKAVFGQ